MKIMLPLMLEASNDLVDHINNVGLKSPSTETREMAMRFTTDAMSFYAFGINAYCFRSEKAEFREASRRNFDGGFCRKVSMASYFLAPVLVKLFKMKFLDINAAMFLENIFKYSIIEREKSRAFKGDLIDLLIQIRRNEQPDSLFMTQAIQFFIAGFETSGSTISFTLYELSLNQPIQDRLRKQIREAIKNHDGITYGAIQYMTYLDMTIKETLRKYPVLPFLDRRCTKAYNIPGTDIVIDKGVPVYMSLLGMHYDPEYFPDPEKFDPKRFTVENKSTRPIYCYMPFGEGPHNCVGEIFGVLSTKVALIRIISDFEVEPCKDTPISLRFDTKGFLTSPKNGLRVKFKRKE